MTDAAILWETVGLSRRGRQSAERLSENGLKRSRANKETGLHPEPCRLMHAMQIRTETANAAQGITDLKWSIVDPSPDHQH